VIAVGEAARERQKDRLRDEMAKKIWSALQGGQAVELQQMFPPPREAGGL
jgi:hypothetical protein